MQNEFLRVPEFMDHYRNLSSHTNKSWEDAILMQLIRSLVGITDLAADPNACNFSLPSEARIRNDLQISQQEAIMSVLLITKSKATASGTLFPLSAFIKYEMGRGELYQYFKSRNAAAA